MEKQKTRHTMINTPKKTSKLLKTISTPNRLQTLQQLNQEKTLDEIVDNLNIKKPSIYPYLKDFKEHRLIKETKDGYQVTDTGRELLELTEHIERQIVHARTGVPQLDVIPEMIEEQTGIPQENIHIEISVEENIEVEKD